MPIALLALTVMAFGIGTTEFVVMGLLPEVAGDFGVTIPAAGHLISGYALGVVVGAPLLTAAAMRLSRKRMLLALTGVFTLGNALSALAPSYPVLLAARVLTALPHGASFGVGAVVAADLVRQDKRARAVSMMFLGLTVANVLGVPAGTALGQGLGWRSAFWLVTLIGLLAMLAIARLIPQQHAGVTAGLRRELAAFRQPQVWLSLGIVALGFGGLFATFSYIAPMMTAVAGYPAQAVPWLLVLLGLGMTAGNLLGGRLADKAMTPTLFLGLGGLAVMLLLFVLTAHSQVAAAVTIFLIGLTGFTLGPTVQTRIMNEAAAAPMMASAANQSAFNVANALGAYLGGVVIAAGFGLTAPNAVGAGLAVIGLALTTLAVVLHNRSRTRSGLPEGTTPNAPPAGDTDPIATHG